MKPRLQLTCRHIIGLSRAEVWREQVAFLAQKHGGKKVKTRLAALVHDRFGADFCAGFRAHNRVMRPRPALFFVRATLTKLFLFVNCVGKVRGLGGLQLWDGARAGSHGKTRH